MSVLQISLLGRVEVTHAGGPASVRLTRRIQALLAYLLLEGRRLHPRETLLELFWGEQGAESARGCLSTALWRLRRALEPGGTSRGTYLLTTPAGEVGFNWHSDHWLDVATFETQVRSVIGRRGRQLEASSVDALEAALRLYEGDLLEGFYEDWALRERERLRCLYLDSLAYLMRYHRHTGAIDQSLDCGERILRHDPLREEIHREMIRLYAQSGDRARALRQYELCRDVLAAELAVAPMEETSALYERIRAAAAGGDVQRRDDAAEVERVLAQLETALGSFEQARRELERVVPLVAQLRVRGRGAA